jgi:hypothetical protein
VVKVWVVDANQSLGVVYRAIESKAGMMELAILHHVKPTCVILKNNNGIVIVSAPDSANHSTVFRPFHFASPLVCNRGTQHPVTHPHVDAPSSSTAYPHA